MALDVTSLAVLGELSRFLKPAAKVAFTPSPAVAQAVMAQAQGGGGPEGGPPGGDPGAGGAPPGGPPGMPPGGPMGAPPGGPPPGAPGDPAAAAGGPPPMDPATQAAPPGADPVSAKLDQLMQMMQQGQGGAGGAGAGKPNTASVKFEPAHFHQMSHDIANMKSVLTQMADMFGLKVPASAMLHQPAPASASTPAPPGADQAAAGPGGPGGQSPLAIQLPALPPVASKSATVLNRLAFGSAVPAQPTDLCRHASLVDRLKNRKGAA